MATVKSEGKARAELERALASAQVEYRRVVDTAQAECGRAVNMAWDKYNRVRDSSARPETANESRAFIERQVKQVDAERAGLDETSA